MKVWYNPVGNRKFLLPFLYFLALLNLIMNGMDVYEVVVSMTGFGRSKVDSPQFSVTVELKSVNHRFREFSIRMPRQLMKIEGKIKNKISEHISRGRIEVYITLHGEGAINRNVQIDWELLHEYYGALEKISDRFGINEEININHLLKREEFIIIEETDVGNEELESSVFLAVEQAVLRLKEMRIAEGKILKKDIISYIELFEGHVTQLFEYAPSVVKQYKQRLHKKIAELAVEQVDENRLLTEVVIFADKSDISEELTRIKSHLGQLLQTVKLDEPIGRKLDFLLQEMNREVNTIGSKANDALIGKEVVEMKSLLEKVKEQVQNIE